MSTSKEPRWAAFLSSILLREIRGFSNLDLQLKCADGQPRMRTLIIGRNGTCKTTLLRAIALGLADAHERPALLSNPGNELLRLGVEKGEIRLEFSRAGEEQLGRTRLELYRHKNERSGETQGWNPFFVAYGASRYSSSNEASRSSRYSAADASAGLFNRALPLSDPELTLRRLKDFQGTHFYQRTLVGIKHLLGLEAEDSIYFKKGGGVEVSGPSVGGSIDLEAWADGYRVTFTWLLDFYGWAMRAGAIDDEGIVRGLLLIDEVEQHLHPSMQAQILPRLSELLPQVQIIATTHSPLVALSAKPEELVALHRREDGTVEAVPAPDFHLYSAEDMLTDQRLFATSPYGEAIDRQRESYRALAAIPKTERKPHQDRVLRGYALSLSPLSGDDDPAASALAEVKDILAKHGIS